MTGLFAIQTSHAQHLSLRTGDARWEIGFNIGPTFFLGDLGGNAGEGTRFIKDINLELTKMMKGGFIAFYPAEWIGFRAAAQVTYVEGQDYIINTTGKMNSGESSATSISEARFMKHTVLWRYTPP